MSKPDDEKLLELVAGFYKSGLSLILATAGGAITIAKTLYENSHYHWVAYISVSGFVLSAIFELGAYEALINRAVKPGRISCKAVEWLHAFSPKSGCIEMLCRHLSGVLYGLGLVAFGFFMWLG
ncbi:hypothetical protein GCM10027285_18520 [Oleiagrimonas citrea]